MPAHGRYAVVIVILFLRISLHAQQIGHLRQTIRSLQNDPAMQSIVLPDSGTVKCATPYLLAVHSRWNLLSPQSKEGLSRVMQRPTLQTSTLSPSGRFRIHFDTTGANQPALIAAGQDVPNTTKAYVDSVAKVLDYVWTYEIDTLGYDPPPPDGIEGGGPEFDVYVEDLGPGEFGYTDWLDADAIPTPYNTRFPTFIVMDNDFLGLRTSGMNGLKVTCAH